MTRAEIQLAIIRKSQALYDLAIEKYKIRNPIPMSIEFSIRGKVAGRAFSGGRLNFNMYMAENNFEDFLNDTVPHEVAHLVAYNLMIQNQRSYKPHGDEWKSIAVSLGGVPNRCHHYSVEPSRRQKFIWICDSCGRKYQVGINKHGKICRNTANYRCSVCKNPIHFGGTLA